MCGIWGAVSKGNSLSATEVDKILPQLLIAGSLRGTDGAGLFSVHKDFSINVTKKEYNSFFLLYEKQFEEHKKKIWNNGIAYFGHNRAATKGKISDKNTHPFETNNIVLVHNGTITSGLGEYISKHEVDSACLAEMIDNLGMVEVSKRVTMAYALVWFDKRDNTLHFCRNNERPLHIVETNSTYFFSSEKEMINWILARNTEKITALHEVPPLKEFVFNLENDTTDTIQLEKPTYSYSSYNTQKEEIPAVGTTIQFKIHSKVTTAGKNELNVYTGRSTKDHYIKFSTKNDINFSYPDLYEATLQSVEKRGTLVDLILKAKTVRRVGTPNNVIVLPNKDEIDDDDILELGDGTLHQGVDFRKKLAFGCGHCSSSLFNHTPESMSEAPDKEKLLCIRCTSEYLMDTTKFKNKYNYKRHVH